jgi:hypothetical protein
MAWYIGMIRFKTITGEMGTMKMDEDVKNLGWGLFGLLGSALFLLPTQAVAETLSQALDLSRH